MKSNIFTPKFIFVSSAIFIATASRLLPHLPNFTPIAAIALFGGAAINDKRLAYLIPFVALFLSDLFLGFSASTLPVYLCFAFTVFLGTTMQKKSSVVKLIGSTLLSSLVFFLVTNLPFWYTALQLYPTNFEGMMMSYTAALPFFGYSIAGDLFFVALLFSAFAYTERSFPSLVKNN